jgi:hypothetical protein
MFFPAADTIAFSEGGVEAMRIDSDGDVGIGTTNPLGKFEVHGQSRFASSASSAVLLIDAAATSTDGVDIQSSYYGGAGYGPMKFSTGGTERMRINAGAPILCLAGGNTSATGTGIAFPVSQSASSDANTLDDYEEGTWTPTGNGVTYSTADGSYTKIGRVVTARFTIVFPVTGSGSFARVGGLPFTTTNSGTDPEFGGSIAFTNFGSSFSIFAFANSTTIQFNDFSGNAIVNATFSAKSVRAVITYFV